MGRPFLRPISLNTGERPGDVLVSYLKEGGTAGKATDPASPTAPFLNLISALIDERTLAVELDPGGVTRSVMSRLTDFERSSVALSAIRVLEDSGASVDRTKLNAVTQALNPSSPLKGESLSVYWQLVLSQFAHGVLSDDDLPISARGLISDEFLQGPVFLAARTRPFLFLHTIVPTLLDALKRRTVKEAVIDEVLRGSLPAAFRELPRAAGASEVRIRHAMRLLGTQLDVLTDTERFKNIANTVIGAAAAAIGTIGMSRRAPKTLSFADISEIESGISQGRARALDRKLSEAKGLDKLLEQHAQRVRSKLKKAQGARVDPVLATNVLPYSEGIYFLIWKEILRRAGIILELRELPWEQVLPALVQDQLSFAVWNDVVPKSSHAKMDMRISVEPLLVYTDYPLIIRRDAAERISGSLPDHEAEWIVQALANVKPLAFEEFKQCRKLCEKLRKEHIGFLPKTDLEEVALQALGGKLEHDKPVSSDEAVEQLVEGRLTAAFVGAIQCSYLKRRFGNSVLVLTNVPRRTPVHLWFKSSTFGSRDYRRLVPALLEAWRTTCRIWAEASNPKDRPEKHLQGWIESLAYLQMNLGPKRATPRIPIEGWSELAQLQLSHDTLDRPERTKPTKKKQASDPKPAALPPKPKEPLIVVSLDEARRALRLAPDTPRQPASPQDALREGFEVKKEDSPIH